MHLGGIFDQEDDRLANAFSMAIDRVNRDVNEVDATEFQAKIVNIRPSDNLAASKHGE